MRAKKPNQRNNFSTFKLYYEGALIEMVWASYL